MDVATALKDYFSKSKLPVLFAGAGVSARCGLPTWGAYLEKLGAVASEYDDYIKFMIDKAVADNALLDAATLYLMCRGMPEARRLSEMRALLEDFDPTGLAGLVKLPFRSVVTTNFDRSLFSAFAKGRGIAPREVNIDDPSLDAAPFADDLYIARIHGRAELPQTMRLSREHFAVLPTNPAYVGFLEHLFTRRQVLFLGFSFLDPAISTVLKSVRAKTGSLHGQEHWAFVPSNASADFMAELELHSIRRIEYSPERLHSELWEGVDDFVSSKVVDSLRTPDVRDAPFAAAKKYLATAYARSSLGKQREPLAQAMAEGVVSGLLSSKQEGTSEADLVLILKSELSLDENTARTLVARSLVSLARDGICTIRQVEGATIYVPVEGGGSAYNEAVLRIVDGVVQRFVLREKGVDSPQVRMFLSSVLGEVLLQRGWELGAAYAGRRMPADVDLGSVMDRIDVGTVKAGEIVQLERSFKDLLIRPDDAEAKILADLGRTAFGLELLLEAPHDALFVSRSLPEIIYFDANVVMPAITDGHPLQKLFSETISVLRRSAGAAATGPSLRVYDGFLNEIVSHRRLAIEAMEANGGEGALWEQRAVGLFGTANVNVYVGAYFNFKAGGGSDSFSEFLSTVAPYDSEHRLKIYLETKGFEVVRESQAERLGVPEILHCLEKFYAAKFEQQRKSPIVVRHDAVQLAILNSDLSNQRRSVFVSADRGIRLALEADGHGAVANSILTHVGLTQLVELVVGRVPSSRGMASLLWMSQVSSDAERIRNHLITIALEKHDAAIAMRMAEVIDDIVEDAGFEMDSRKLRLDSDSAQDKVVVSRVLERYETDFFRKMNKEIERSSRR